MNPQNDYIKNLVWNGIEQIMRTLDDMSQQEN